MIKVGESGWRKLLNSCIVLYALGCVLPILDRKKTVGIMIKIKMKNNIIYNKKKYSKSFKNK